MEARRLQAHITATYRALRAGLVALGLALPWVLWIGGRLAGDPLQRSMSAYYFTPMRDVFVGTLFAVAALLVLYKGYTVIEDRVLDLAGVLLAGVALFHADPPGCGAAGPPVNPHGVLAVLFFACIAYVGVFRASDTLGLVHDAARAARFRRTDRLLGALMIASPLVAVVLRLALQAPGGGARSLAFFAEATGTTVFAVYWLVKSREIALTDSERLAAEGRLATRAHGATDVLALCIPVELAAPGGAGPEPAARGRHDA